MLHHDVGVRFEDFIRHGGAVKFDGTGGFPVQSTERQSIDHCGFATTGRSHNGQDICVVRWKEK